MLLELAEVVRLDLKPCYETGSIYGHVPFLCNPHGIGLLYDRIKNRLLGQSRWKAGEIELFDKLQFMRPNRPIERNDVHRLAMLMQTTLEAELTQSGYLLLANFQGYIDIAATAKSEIRAPLSESMFRQLCHSDDIRW